MSRIGLIFWMKKYDFCDAVYEVKKNSIEL